MTLRPLSFGLGATVLLFSACSGEDAGATTSVERAGASEAEAVEVPPFAEGLLELAFDAATDFPIHPHIKTRSRVQEQVVQACFDLGLVDRALPYIERIDNWRRGAGYADYAYAMARRGDASSARKYVDLATQVAADHAANPTNSQWRTDRIRAKIARVYLKLGEVRDAAEFSSELDPSQIGIVDGFLTEQVTDESYDDHVAELERTYAIGDLERVKSTMASFLALYDRYYDDEAKRRSLQERIVLPDERVPLTIRLGFLFEAVEIALDKDDSSTASDLLGEVQSVVDAARWLPEDETPVRAKLGSYRFRGGEEQVGRTAIDAAVALYDENESRIVNINRSDALLPVAEAYVAIGDRKEAVKIYRRALAVAFENPNSRPRCEDFVALCCSLAVRGFDPGEALDAELRERRQQLGSPW